MKRVLLTLAMAGLIAGCAGEQAMRATSAQSALILSQYRSELTQFAARQNELNAADLERIQRWQQRRAERDGEVQSRLRAWRLAGDERAVDRFEILSALSGEEILSTDTLLSTQAAETLPTLRFDAAAVESIIKRLKELQRPRSPIDQARDLLAFTTKLRDSYEESLEQAAAPTEGAAAPADQPVPD